MTARNNYKEKGRKGKEFRYRMIDLSLTTCAQRLAPRIIDYRLYQMSLCVSIPMIFVSAISARATLTAKMALTAKMREFHLLPKWRPTKNRGHNFG